MGRPFNKIQHYVAYPSLRGYSPERRFEEHRARFESQVDRPFTETFLQHLAICQIWRGTQQDGRGVIRFSNMQRPIQAFAYELYYAPIPTTDPLDFKNRDTPVKMVARCVAAGTKDCVHKNHLAVVRAGTDPCPPLDLAERQFVRARYEAEGGELTLLRDLEGRGKLALARIARIVSFLEGPNDPH